MRQNSCWPWLRARMMVCNGGELTAMAVMVLGCYCARRMERGTKWMRRAWS